MYHIFKRLTLTPAEVKAIYQLYIKYIFTSTKEDDGVMKLVSFIMYCKNHSVDDEKVFKFIKKHRCGLNWF